MESTAIQTLGCRIGRARRALRREFESRIAPLDLTVPQVVLLMSLWQQDGQTITELARVIAADAPTLTSLLDRLEAKDLLIRERDPRDRRVIRIHLRPEAGKLKSAVLTAGEAVMDRVKQGMKPEEFETLCLLLGKLTESLDGRIEEGTD